MSHRSALIVSIALTLVLALGIFAGRDRLLRRLPMPAPSTITPTSLA